MNTQTASLDRSGPVVIYDGDCPLCASYVAMSRLRESVGEVELVNARETHPVIDEARAAGMALNDGMVVKLDGQLYHGAEAMMLLTALSTRSGLFNRLMRGWFASPGRARFTYPWLVRGRLILLKLLGRKPIDG